MIHPVQAMVKELTPQTFSCIDEGNINLFKVVFYHYFQFVTLYLQKQCAGFNRHLAPPRRPIDHGSHATCPVDYSSQSVIDARISVAI